MFDNLLPMLAVDEKWFYYVVVGIAIAASIISNMVKEAKQRREQRERQLAKGSEAGDDLPDRPVPSSLGELTQRRRRQLQQLAHRRKATESRSGAGTAISKDMANLTAAQRGERERARAAYEQRAAQLRGQVERKATTPPEVAVRRTKLTRRKPQQTVGQRPLLGSGILLGDKPRLPVELGSRDLGTGVITAAPSRIPGEADRPVRHVPDVRLPASSRRAPIASFLRHRRSLRTAVLLKEILDRPIALRDDRKML
jgi:hypothetical protein